MEKWHHLFQTFPFSAKVELDRELNLQFLPKIGSFDICRCIQAIPRIGTYLQFLGSLFEKWRHNFFGAYFEAILSTKHF